MVIARSSQAVASGGVKHRAAEKSEADRQEKNIEHKGLNVAQLSQ
ncbi:MAG: hypothetical protein ABI191_05170 [Rhizomicrobium sp.]